MTAKTTKKPALKVVQTEVDDDPEEGFDFEAVRDEIIGILGELEPEDRADLITEILSTYDPETGEELDEEGDEDEDEDEDEDDDGGDDGDPEDTDEDVE